MPSLTLKASHKVVTAFYGALDQFEKLGVSHEGAVSSAFETLLEHCAAQVGRTLIPKYLLKRKGAKNLIPDAALVDSLSKVLLYGLWEAKDSADDLEKEIKAKFSVGYPRDNILFQEPKRAILYQNGHLLHDADLSNPNDLVHILGLFFNWQPPAFDAWETAVEEFSARVPELGKSLVKLIRRERTTNTKYRAAFEGFVAICRSSVNPNLSEAAVEEMVVQHLLTERIFRKVFDVGDFMQRNVIAKEIETVIEALTSRNFSRDKFSDSLEHFYVAIERAAETISAFDEKQKFLNRVYERFFQGFSVKVADTHGIVYTPQPLVDFMVASIEHVLASNFDTSLAASDVHLLDPFTGTGNFVVNVMHRLPQSSLRKKFATELWCNEVMLLPYYVASMNIEHAYWEAVGAYEPFAGICLVDTFQTVEDDQGSLAFFNEANSERVDRQRRAPIKVIVANPPYNAGQIDENDNNKNRRYPAIDKRVKVTYSTASEASLVRKLSDPYVKAIRFATDRIGPAGVVCYVNNNSFISESSFDGMRRHLAQDFDLLYILDLGGNVRKNPELSGTVHNVFGIQVGVSVNVFVKLPQDIREARMGKVLYYATPVDWRREEKYDFLAKAVSIGGIKWKQLKPDRKNNWFASKLDSSFETYLPLGDKYVKANRGAGLPTVFRTYSLGISTNRDAVVYDFDVDALARRVEGFADDYNAELARWRKKARVPKTRDAIKDYVDKFVDYDRIKWSETLKRHLVQQTEAQFDRKAIADSLYRPFTRMSLYDAPLFVDRPGKFGLFLPNKKSAEENLLLLVPSVGARSPFWCFVTNLVPNLNFVSIDSAQCFPLFTYSEDGRSRRDNIPSQTVAQFREYFSEKSITSRDIFYYVYAILHHPMYRSRYAADFRNALPRVPLIGGRAEFKALSGAGKELTELHVGYDRVKGFRLKRQEKKGVRLDWRVEMMRLDQERGTIVYNDYLTLEGLPSEAFEYRLGNRSAIEWVVDQYRVSRDEHGEIVRDPNRANDEEYVVNLVSKVVAISVRTVEICQSLPAIDWKKVQQSHTH